MTHEQKTEGSKVEKVNAPKFNRNAILRSIKYSRYVDMLAPYLKDGEFYTSKDIDKILKDKYNIKRSD